MERPRFRQELHPLVVKSQVASGEGELDTYHEYGRNHDAGSVSRLRSRDCGFF
jgi:hypothetical protein